MGRSFSGHGEAGGGFEFQGVTTVLVKGASSSRARADIDAFTKTGFYIDYKTADGYTKRVFLSCGTATGMQFSDGPPWGARSTPNQVIDIGRRASYQFDLDRWAPKDWDGTCWFTAYMQNAGNDGKLVASIGWK